ncbi:MAG: hypothetical protein D6805_04820 [Planctomycetota bacterium]|nr:MAG: hypothetical protein D6805_04820 [Planctomycetota bacterium]
MKNFEKRFLVGGGGSFFSKKCSPYVGKVFGKSETLFSKKGFRAQKFLEVRNLFLKRFREEKFWKRG